MPDFGIGEALAAFGAGDALGLGGLFGGAEAAAAAAPAAAGEFGWLAAPELAGAGLTAAPGAAALGAPAAALTVEGLAPAAGFGIGDFLGGVGAGAGALASGVGDFLFPGASAAPMSPSAGPGVSSSTSGINTDLLQPGAGTGVGASGFAPAPGVQLPGGIAPDATSAAAFNPTDTFAGRAGAVQSAIQSGTFDPTGANFTTFGGGPDVGAGVPGTQTPLPGPGVSATAPAGGPSGTAGLDQQILGIQGGAGAPQSLAPPAGAAAPAGGAPAEGGGFLDKIGSSVMKNPVGLGLGAAGLGYNILAGQKQSAAMQALEQQALQQSQTGNQLASYLQKGTLPPGLQGSVDQATASAKANAVANAAAQGLPTDPTQNTALAMRLAQIDQQGPIVAAQIAQQLLSSGASFSGLSNQLYMQLAQIDQQQTQNIGKAIANMAAALNTGGTKIQIGGSAAA